MRCDDCRPRLRAHADGELGFFERLSVSAHLRRCRDCAARLAGIRTLAAEVAALDAPQPAAAPARRSAGRAAARLAVEIAIALAIGFGAFEATDRALSARPAATTARSAAAASSFARANEEDLRPPLVTR